MDFVTTLAQLGRCTLQRIGRTPGLHRPEPYCWVTDAETGRPFRIPQGQDWATPNASAEVSPFNHAGPATPMAL